ncbi:MAG: leuD [Microbacterium sp.]|jgi:3-isopropylmalate/(R)-2-methylmalate dehydratase small subunit|nr:leuD [Microbacterium sp.]MDF2554225.1 leuD [Microbacterium sp.]
MEAFTTHTGIAAPLKRSAVDTDQIIPAVYLKRVTKTGFEDALFANWRQDPDFLLNQPTYARSSILVAGPDFGTGSSREHAVWALRDYGFRVVLSSKFADIFRGNAGKQGLLTGVVSDADIEALWAAMDAAPGAEMTVDLERRDATIGDLRVSFEIDDYTRWRLLEGLDDIGLTLRNEDKIAAYEARREPWKPRTLPVPPLPAQ